MGITMGWIAVVLAGVAGAPPAKPAGPDIVYQYQIVEMHGLQWRAQAGGGLRPVTSHGAVSVWTAPASFLKSLPAGTAKQTLAAPRVTAASMAPAHVTTRKNQALVTQAAWVDEAKDLRIKYENVRSGMAATVAGRKLDQGVLVQLVIEDTDIRAVHNVNVTSPAEVSFKRHPGEPADCCVSQASHGNKPSDCCAAQGAQVSAAARTARDASWPFTFSPLAAGRTTAQRACDSACPTSGHPGRTDSQAKQAAWTSVAGSACCADDADNARECHETEAAEAAASAQVQVPEIGREAVAGEWLIPHGEVLVVSFGPHTVADKDGKAVVREKLALVTAEEADAVSPSSAAIHQALPQTAMPRSLPNLAAPAPMAVPKIPSRSIPQGVHADGTPAALPPLPDDETCEQPASEPSQPMPSPQNKKPRPSSQPAPGNAKPAASVDQKTSKASFIQAQPWLQAAGLLSSSRASLAATFLPMPNLKFMVPLKPFSLKLPMGQKLEFELIGRVVPDPEAALAADDD
jgi:hypothetical protein